MIKFGLLLLLVKENADTRMVFFIGRATPPNLEEKVSTPPLLVFLCTSNS